MKTNDKNNCKPEAKSGAVSGRVKRLVSLLRERGPMRAGDLGFELWAKPGQECKCENITATMYIRPATKLLYEAQRLGLVRCREHGKSRLWEANVKSHPPTTESDQ